MNSFLGFKKLDYIINTSRGEVLILKDLLKLLKSGKIKGVAFGCIRGMRKLIP